MSEKSVTSTKFPYLPITIGIRKRVERVEALLDTGFDGDLVLPPGLITNGKPPDSYLRWKLADTSEVLVPAYLGRVEVADLGDAGTFAAVISILGNEPIIGRSLSNRFSITLDHGRRLIIKP